MASTITAAEGYGYRVILTVTPDPADMGATITITRETGALPPVEVAGGVDLPAEATVVVDAAVPLGVSSRWVMTGALGESVASGTVTVSPPAVAGYLPGGCLLSRPETGDYVAVALVEWPTRDFQSLGKAVDVPGRRDRIWVADVEQMPEVSPTLLTVTGDDAAALNGILSDGSAVLFRAPCPQYDDAAIVVTSHTERRISRQSDARTHALDGFETEPDLSVRAAGDTLDMLHAAEPGTLADIAARWDTLQDIAAADLASEVL